MKEYVHSKKKSRGKEGVGQPGLEPGTDGL